MAAALSPQLHAELTARLEQLLDQADDLRSAKASLGRALGAELWVVQSQIANVRAQLKGQDAPQLQIPGAEVGDHRTDPVVVRLLALAGKTREPAPAPAKAKAPAKREPLDDLVGSREEAVARHEAKGGKRAKPVETALSRAQKACLREAQLRRSPAWLMDLVVRPGAPIFSARWWPNLGPDGRPVHAPVKTTCPSSGEDWRDCATCVAAVSVGKKLEAATP